MQQYSFRYLVYKTVIRYMKLIVFWPVTKQGYRKEFIILTISEP